MIRRCTPCSLIARQYDLDFKFESSDKFLLKKEESVAVDLDLTPTPVVHNSEQEVGIFYVPRWKVNVN